MSKHKTPKKKLIIEDDEPKDDDALNPFSFKEFIRSKNQHSSTIDSVEKTFDSACSMEDNYKYAIGFEPSPKGPFFTDPSLLEQSFDCKPEDEWTESCQNLGVDQAHDLGPNCVLEESVYLDQSLLSCEDEDETVNDWELREDFSRRHEYLRKSTGSYEGDEESSVVDLSFQVKNDAENGILYRDKLREENAQLRKHIKELLQKSDADSAKIRQLTDELHSRNLQEEREAKALESMVQSVEENLQLMTKRAVKAESSLSKLKQEVQQLQSQLDVYRCENEKFRAGETAALNSMRQNAHVASKYLVKVAQDAETSLKQLLTGRETLCFVSELLSSIDKITEIQK